MQKEVTILSATPGRKFGNSEQAVMALLFACGIIQIGAMIGAFPDATQNAKPTTAALVQLHNGTMLAKK